MDEELKKMIANTMKEEYNARSIRFKEIEESVYKIFGLVENKYKHICTVDRTGNIIEYRKIA